MTEADGRRRDAALATPVALPAARRALRPARYGLRGLVRLTAGQDHVGVWPAGTGRPAGAGEER